MFNIVDQVGALARTDNAVDATGTLRCCALIEYMLLGDMLCPKHKISDRPYQRTIRCVP
ncbi:protein of unknown function (plasmid) [Cupriavidus taiwanensis]|uniref:Transposase n=1 Tax=Cupriavidus taiwanensis TaxID=164546 RepID=A0A375EDR0_9BURK|nr:protein of unknown function [Cupriavidus taiwanensis]SOZ72032.1 protein of unknown function [Cupriavidus taiwanensis]SOZ74369.1 protein of unknown function [Cupriavidus taiwanensis]